ncbi:MAG: ABC transporter permease [bacterium]|nr:ABC transporter permease [bacterium]
MKNRMAAGWTVGPAFAYLVLFFLIPLGIVFTYSFFTRGPYGQLEFSFTLQNYRNILDPLYLPILLRSIWLSLLTTFFSLLFGYPVAWAISRMQEQRRFFYLLLIIIPSWMNLLIKNYAWIVILRRQGLVNTLLSTVGLIHEPLPLLFNEGAVLVGLIHTYLPFSVLPIFATLEKLDRNLLDAARDLGAGPWQTFRHVILPQTFNGILAGAVLVFVPCLGAFITPDLLGGAGGMMVGNLIQNQILEVRDWPFGSALSVFLMAVILLVIFAGTRFSTRVVREDMQ